MILHAFYYLLPNIPLQNLAHMLIAGIKVGELQHIKLGDHIGNAG